MSHTRHNIAGLAQLVWVQAAKRIGAVYACLPTTLSIKALADRIADLQVCCTCGQVKKMAYAQFSFCKSFITYNSHHES